MTRQRLQEVTAYLDGDNLSHEKNIGYGLRNVKQRIQLYYGKQYGLSIESEHKKGTHVMVIIPIVGVENA